MRTEDLDKEVIEGFVNNKCIYNYFVSYFVSYESIIITYYISNPTKHQTSKATNLTMLKQTSNIESIESIEVKIITLVEYFQMEREIKLNKLLKNE